MKIKQSIIAIIFASQMACVSSSETQTISASNVSLKTSSTPTVEVSKNAATDIQTAKIEAQKMIDSGITFSFTQNIDGETEDGGIFTGHGYRSSDGVEIGTSVALYKKRGNAKDSFQESLMEIEKVLESEDILDDGKTVGQRFVGITKNRQFIIGKINFNNCKFYNSSSLIHLLAFEKWRETNNESNLLNGKSKRTYN